MAGVPRSWAHAGATRRLHELHLALTSLTTLVRDATTGEVRPLLSASRRLPTSALSSPLAVPARADPPPTSQGGGLDFGALTEEHWDVVYVERSRCVRARACASCLRECASCVRARVCGRASARLRACVVSA